MRLFLILIFAFFATVWIFPLSGPPMSPKTRISFPHAFPATGVAGLSLRDYFAAATVQGYTVSGGPLEAYETAKSAYRMADAMLAARSEVQP